VRGSVERIGEIPVKNDEDLKDVRSVLEGDLLAFENIVRRWQKPLINLAFRFCRNRDRAEEMAQDAFVQIYRNLNKFRADAAFSTWLFAVSLNLYRSSMRHKPEPEESIDSLLEFAGGELPHLRLEQEERDELIRRAVAALPLRYRDAMIVFYFRELDLKETAAILGVSEGTAKSWLHRGREMLRTKLESSAASSAEVKEVYL